MVLGFRPEGLSTLRCIDGLQAALVLGVALVEDNYGVTVGDPDDSSREYLRLGYGLRQDQEEGNGEAHLTLPRPASSISVNPAGRIWDSLPAWPSPISPGRVSGVAPRRTPGSPTR